MTRKVTHGAMHEGDTAPSKPKSDPRLWVTFVAQSDKTWDRNYREFLARQINVSYHNPNNFLTKSYSSPKQIIITSYLNPTYNSYTRRRLVPPTKEIGAEIGAIQSLEFL